MANRNKKRWGGLPRLVTLLFLAVPILATAQLPTDFGKVKSEALSDEQIAKMLARAEERGLSQNDMFAEMRKRGVPDGEIAKIQKRAGRLGAPNASGLRTSATADTSKRNVSGAKDDGPPDIDLEKPMGEKTDASPKIFGSSLFRNGNIRFEPNLNMPTPVNYIVGPGDHLHLDITGDNEATYKPVVSTEGRIRADYIGMVDVGGLTIEAVRAKLRSAFADIYPGLRTGRTRLDVNLGNIRSIKITMTGNVTQSGTYTLPSFATVYNALYAAGGPSAQGSFRNIQVIRNNAVIGTVDTYDFLVNGLRTGDVRLEDQDVIHIPVYQKRVEMSGMVKNPALFELKEGERLSDVLKYAGGFAPAAYTHRIKAIKVTARERFVQDVYAADFPTYAPKNGDQYIVEEILDRYANRVQIEGAVFRPGNYELADGLTVGQLIAKAEGPMEDAFMDRGYINRLNPDNTLRLIPFDLRKLLNGQTADIPLQREDHVVISSIFDLREEYTVSVNGEVRRPGKFRYADGMTLGSAILMAGGLTDAANIERVEVAHRLRGSTNDQDSVISELMVLDFGSREEALRSDFELAPFDVVNIRVSGGYIVQKQVRIEGEVKYPGVYTLKKKNARISDLLARAGGLTDYAYPQAASLLRTASDTKLANESSLVALGSEQDMALIGAESDKQLADALESQEKEGASTSIAINNYVGIELGKILRKPHSSHDLFMEDGDVLVVPRMLHTVTVRGQVLNANRIRYEEGRPLTYYIAQAGGFTSNALRRKIFVQYANGSVTATKRVLGRVYPKIAPGAEIIVPKKPEKEKTNPQLVVGVMSSIVSMAAVVVALLR